MALRSSAYLNHLFNNLCCLLTISSLTGHFTLGFLKGHSYTPLYFLFCCIFISSSSISHFISVSSLSISTAFINFGIFLSVCLWPSVAMLLFLSAYLTDLLLALHISECYNFILQSPSDCLRTATSGKQVPTEFSATLSSFTCNI